MAALATSVSSWIAEDDILLKNAVEAGASLEALAKGAVRFSRNFTIQELRDRWHSLLYDPVISAEASDRMVEFELSTSSKSTRSGIGMGSAEFTSKRKFASVRRLYHALRKKACIQPSNSPNISLLVSPNRNGTSCQGNHDTPVVSSMLGDCVQNRFEFREMDIDSLRCGPQVRDAVKHDIVAQKNEHEDPAHIIGETLLDLGNCPAVEGMGPSNALLESDASFHSLEYSSLQLRTPLCRTIEDISAPAMPIDLSHEDKGQVSEETFILPDYMDEKNRNLYAISETGLADLSDSLLNLENDDELHPLGADGKVTIDKSCNIGNNPTLSSSSNKVHQEDVPDIKEPETCPAIPDSPNHAELEVIAVQSLSGNGNQHGSCGSDVNVPPSSLIGNCLSHDLPEGEIECTLNSEDPEIPCNNDFLPGKVTSSSVQVCSKEASDLAPSVTARKNNENNISKMRKEGNSAPCFAASSTGGADLFLGSNHDHQLSNCGVKSKFLDVHSPAIVPRQANNAHVNPSQCRITLATQKFFTQAGVEQESLHAYNVTDLQLHANSSTNPSTLDHEAFLDESESESGDDIPYFSDIESLILNMDLCPDGRDSCFSKEVPRYQHEDTKRTIIRLEQCARSAMQRAIGYQGALAIFYGRRLKHYIKTTEIILGRATGDIDVDIDLGREGRANKISRRQALIKMEQAGSFFLKNLGGISIFLNGREIAKGQAASLSSSSLIEVGEMAFMFEINYKFVREYLANATKRNQDKNTKFEWSERVP